MRTIPSAAGLIACLLAAATAAFCQPPPPQFEVASIKPSSPNAARNGSGSNSGKGRLVFTNSSLKRCIMGAYGVGQNEIVGGPDWLDQDLFDIQAKAEEKAGDEEMM